MGHTFVALDCASPLLPGAWRGVWGGRIDAYLAVKQCGQAASRLCILPAKHGTIAQVIQPADYAVQPLLPVNTEKQGCTAPLQRVEPLVRYVRSDELDEGQRWQRSNFVAKRNHPALPIEFD